MNFVRPLSALALDAWEEGKHPRGQPKNAGQFASKPGGKGKGKGGETETPSSLGGEARGGREELGRGSSGTSPAPAPPAPREQVDGALDVRKYLKIVADVHGRAMPKGMMTPASLLLRHGQPFIANDKTYEGERLPPHMCYMNSFHDMLDHPDRDYVEGYILVHGVPIEHAWTVDKSGQIYDRTIKGLDPNISGYFGIPFNRDYVLKSTLKNGYYGLLGHNSRKTLEPLLQGKVKDFKAKPDPKILTTENVQSRIEFAEQVAAGIPETYTINTPERAALRKKIEDDYWDQIKDKPQGHKAIIILGLPGIGKTSFARPLEKEGGVYVEADGIKEHLPEYGSGEGAAAVHEESSIIARSIRNRAIEAGLNLIWPRIDSPDKIKKDIESLTKAGYEVDVKLLTASEDIAINSALNRFLVGDEHGNSRYVSPLTIKNFGDSPTQAYEVAKATGLVRNAERYHRGTPDPATGWSEFKRVGDLAKDDEWTEESPGVFYKGRQGRRVGGGRYEIAHTYEARGQEFRHHEKEKAKVAAEEHARKVGGGTWDAVEVEESYQGGLLRATTRGGAQVVTITEHPERTEKELYNPSAGAGASGGRARWKTIKTPSRFEVKWPGGSQVVLDYDRAVQLAVRKAGSARDAPISHEQLDVLKEAQSEDRLGYLRGLRSIEFDADVGKWNSEYNAVTDAIRCGPQFSTKPYSDQLRTMLHEAAHRGGLKVDKPTFEAFCKAGLARRDYFLVTANPVHFQDAVERGGVSDGEVADEVFAESYARYILGLEQPLPLNQFWQRRFEAE
jgi:hypothetical protein